MATLKAIRKRISSIRNTQQITKAMKMVSAAKLRRAQEAAMAARPYADKMVELLHNVAARVSREAHPLLRAREEKKIHVLLFTSDRGLCGGYNANLIRAAEAFIRREGAGKEINLVLVGRKGVDHFRRRRATIADRYINILATPAEKLLPVALPETESTEQPTEYLYEPSVEAILASLLPKVAEVAIFRALLEATASEHGARMTAMDSATNNASKMMGTLTLQMNRARQASITREL